MVDAKLNNGDMPLIARIMGINKDTIRYILNGRRGKRGTELQNNIIKAVEFRAKQNEELNRYCKSISIEKVIPTTTKQ